MTKQTSRPRGPGRPRDESRDPEILQAARDELSARGYERMTMSAVAARAGAGKATVYRRWDSKAELVIDAVAVAVDAEEILRNLPDGGSLVDDLHALRKLGLNDQRMWQALVGLSAELQKNPELGAAIHERLVDPRVRVIHGLLERARIRGELRRNDMDIELLAQIPAAMVAYRILVLGKPIDTDFLVSTCEEVLLPLVT
ncbi:TetR/AcrR family transcriptional regulator [Leucobacter soli]|nr:TetR/AcrR family transcriptional regulator [Leucobacter soli]